ncbi:MAG TPA: hypothetical protein VJ983_10310, partial [candidate division Zixibacteria bacterium]|nr:hypothetical protein [candidate division Zixibacteria bacterium]
MSHFRTAVSRSLSVALWVCLATTVSFAQELVTRDDFTCSDTTTPAYWLGLWPEVAIDAEGNINEVNLMFLDPTGTGEWCHQYTKFDRFGNQIQPVVNFLPDASDPDSVWESYGIVRVDCNDDGTVVIPYRARKPEPYPTNYIYRRFMALFDSNGSEMEGPLCMSCRPQETFAHMNHPLGAINNNGLVGYIWRSDGCQFIGEGQEDSVWIRLYDTKTDSLYPLWRPTTEVQPFNHYCGRQSAAIGISDDGHVAATWIAEEAFAHAYYTIYDVDGNQVFPITMVDCKGDFFDTSGCNTCYSVTVNMTMEPDGDFYIVWHNREFGIPIDFNGHIWMAGFNADGTPKYEPIRVTDTDSTYVDGYQLLDPKITCDTAGNVLVLWSDSRFWPESSHNDFFADVFLQKIDPDGNLVGPNYRVNNIGGASGLSGTHCSVDMNNAGQVVAIWRNYRQPDYTPSIKAQLMPYDQVGRFVPGDL